MNIVEEHETLLWADAIDPIRRHQFVQLLNGALRDDLGARGVWYFPKDLVYAFAGNLKEAERKYEYASVSRERSEITVVNRKVSKSKDGREFEFLRHHAFKGRFRKIDKGWYLEVTPTYLFTSNGRDKYRFHEDQLAGIKRFEKNRAVLSQVLLWNDVLRPKLSLWDRRKFLLAFGTIEEFQVDRGLVDERWSDTSDDDDRAEDLALFAHTKDA